MSYYSTETVQSNRVVLRLLTLTTTTFLTQTDQDFTGRSIANLGDINGDGINDIAVGAPGNTNNSKEGSVFTILMRRRRG